jgi:hypothetical protein
MDLGLVGRAAAAVMLGPGAYPRGLASQRMSVLQTILFEKVENEPTAKISRRGCKRRRLDSVGRLLDF